MKAVPIEIDGKLEYKWSIRGEIQVWDLQTGKQLPSLTTSPTRGFLHATLSPDGTKLAVIDRESTGVRHTPNDGLRYYLRLWDIRRKTCTELAPQSAMPAFSPDGTILAANLDADAKRSVIRLWDVATAKERSTIPNAAGFLSRPFFSHDGRLIATTCNDYKQKRGEVRLWDVATGKLNATLAAPHSGTLWYRLAFSPDDRVLAATQRDTGCLYLFDVPARKLARTILLGQHAGPHEPVFSPDGQLLAIACQELPSDLKDQEPDPADLPQPRIFLFNLASLGEPEEIVCPHGFVGDLAFGPDSKRLALGSYGCALLFDLNHH
jgi:WD40 repeat protein